MRFVLTGPRLLSLSVWLILGIGASNSAAQSERKPLPDFERVVIDNDLPGGYQVEIADINGDGRPDIIALGGGTCAWYENPRWTKRIISDPKRTPGIISSASADLDGDGKAEVMIAYEFSLNEPKKGKLAIASQSSKGDSWTLTPIADIGSIHRLRFGDFDGDGRLELAVAPIVGPTAAAPSYNQSPAPILIYRRSADGKGKDKDWERETIAERPVMHAIDVLKRRGGDHLLSADNLGASLYRRDAQGHWQASSLFAGAKGDAPQRGCSEIHKGKIRIGEGKTAEFLATVEPWHGTTVAVGRDDGKGGFTDRTIIDREIGEGHALWVADVDGDGDDEIFAGDRGKATRVTGYDFNGKTWTRSVLDPQIAAQDLRGGDLDNDGLADFVAVGGSTHNVVWYRPRSATARK